MDEVVGDGEGGALDAATLGDGEGGVDHVIAAVALGDAHRPDLVIVAGAGVGGAEGGREETPGETVGGDEVLDDVVVGEGEMEEVEVVAVGEDLDVADFRETEAGGGVHGV